MTAAASTIASTCCCMRWRASWDTKPCPKPTNFNFNKKTPKPSPSTTTQTSEVSTATRLKKEELPYTQLWNSLGVRSNGEKVDELYLGYERWTPVAPKWLPVAPKVKKPRSIYNAASLAYLGDCIYELYARRHFLFPPKSIDVYNERVMAIVRCEAQDALLKKLLNEDYLTEEERDVLRWGKNIASSKTRTKKRAGVQVYSRASSLETLIGYLYLTDAKRLEDLMRRLGFSAGASTEQTVDKTPPKSE